MSVFNATLPKTWIREPLASRYRVTKKPRTLNLADHPQIVFAPMEAVPSRGQHRIDFQLRAQEQIASGTYFERGDVLLSKITPSFENGKQGMAVGLSEPFGYASTEIIPLQAEGDANNWFLFYYLLDPEVRSLLTDRMEGSTGRQRVPIHAVNTLQMSFPPVPEQEKIAAVLWKVQRAAELEEKLVATTRELKSAAMRRLFSAGLNSEPAKETKIGPIPESWVVSTIRSEAKLASGGTPSRTAPEYWKGGTIPWVKTGEVNYCVIIDTEEKITPLALKHSAAKMFPAGTVLVAMYGQGVTRGKAALLGIEAATNQACVGLVPKTSEMSAEYLYYYLSASYETLRCLAHGAQQQNLNIELVGNFPIPKPSVDEQQAIVTALQGIDRKIALHERRGAILRELFASLLYRLMTGEVRVDNLEIDVAEVRA